MCTLQYSGEMEHSRLGLLNLFSSHGGFFFPEKFYTIFRYINLQNRSSFITNKSLRSLF